MKKRTYLHFHPKYLKGHDVFPFHIYLRHPVTKTYTPFLKGNDPLTKDRRQTLAGLLKKGAILAIHHTQRLTFLYYLNLSEDSFGELGKKMFFPENHDVKDSVLPFKATEQEEIAQDISPLKQEQFIEHLQGKLAQDDFLPIIKQARSEILLFSTRTSSTISLAHYLAEQFLQEDTYLNRKVALSYFLMRFLDIEAEADLSLGVCLAFLDEVGKIYMTQTAHRLPSQNLAPQDQVIWAQLPLKSLELIKLSEGPIDDFCLNTLAGKTSEQNQINQVIHCTSILLLTSMGKLDGKKQKLVDVMEQLANNKIKSGLKFKISDTILKKLTEILSYYKIVQAA